MWQTGPYVAASATGRRENSRRTGRRTPDRQKAAITGRTLTAGTINHRIATNRYSRDSQRIRLSARGCQGGRTLGGLIAAVLIAAGVLGALAPKRPGPCSTLPSSARGVPSAPESAKIDPVNPR
jgi:hypothetical protein